MIESAVSTPFVLSVDDDEDARLLLDRAFIKAGVKAVLKHLTDGGEAIRYLTGEAAFSDRKDYPLPDLMLLDLKMPRVNGFDVLHFIKKEGWQPTFPIIVFSSSDIATDVQKAYALGCNSYVVKPSEFHQLVQLVSALEADFLRPEKEHANGAGAFSRFVIPKTAPPPKHQISQEESDRFTGEEPPEMFRLLVEQVKDYAIFMLDREGRVLTWNQGAQRIKGYKPSEIIGKHFSAFYPRPDVEMEKPQFELRVAKELGRYEEEGWRIRKDGSRFWASVIITALRDTEGNLTGYGKVTRDLTQRKLQEEHIQRLLESEERFRFLVEQVRDYAIFMLDARGNVSSWNEGARRLKGYTADEIIGRHFSTFFPADEIAKERPARELNVAIQEGRYEEEGWRIRKDGTRFWANVVITALWDKRGNLSGFAKVTRDLSEKKKEEEALRHKNEELEAFAHTLSHDLRAPLRSISSFAQILRSEADYLSNEQKTTYLCKIVTAAASMERLISDVLTLSQLSLAPIMEQTVPLREVIDETLLLNEGEIQGTKAEVRFSSELPAIRANRTLLTQVFSNLVSNALKFTRNGERPHIEIFARNGGDLCEIHVKDLGPGIPPRFQKSIFDIFERGEAGPTAAGAGVGLAIVKRAVERMGGTISLDSKVGEGSDFIVTLPCVAETAETRDAKACNPENPAPP